ncbi:tenascin isoform X1, partial [Tachysurus ichikawai]
MRKEYVLKNVDVDSPEDLEASNILTESATLTWKAPQAQISGYILTYESADGTVREVVLSPTSTSYNMNQLSASTEYTARLQAISGPLRSHIISTVFTTSESIYVHKLTTYSISLQLPMFYSEKKIEHMQINV